MFKKRVFLGAALLLTFSMATKAAILVGCVSVPGGENCLICDDEYKNCKVVQIAKKQ